MSEKLQYICDHCGVIIENDKKRFYFMLGPDECDNFTLEESAEASRSSHLCVHCYKDFLRYIKGDK